MDRSRAAFSDTWNLDESDQAVERGEMVANPSGGTRMRWSWTLEPRGVLRFLGPILASMGRRQERRIWTSLKQLLEARAQ